MTPTEKAQAEAASWKRWQGEWGNTESGAHAYGWQEGYKAGQAEAHIARELLQEIVDAYGLGGSAEATCRWIEDPVMQARRVLSE